MKKRIAQATAVMMVTALIICLGIIRSPLWYLSYGPNNLHHYATQEEFLEKMESLDEEYNTDIFSRNSDRMLALAKMYDYNEYVIPALMCIETHGGNNMYGTFNYWNLRQWQSIVKDGEVIHAIPGFAFFETEEEAFNTLSDVLYKHFYPDNETYVTFSEKWCPTNITFYNSDSLSLTDLKSYDVMLYKMVQHIQYL
ncbi:MAG: hypothetical protein K2H53_05315 [Clostridia bacterium]|nr:hypothetical protein [Clostridia bacterium]